MRALLAQPQAPPMSCFPLDAAQQRMRDFVFKTVRKRSIPVLMVTHDALTSTPAI
jgi:ABC-type uncharacterized transport system YnjBCD ATPase subunit